MSQIKTKINNIMIKYLCKYKESDYIKSGQLVEFSGWIRNIRNDKFLIINDGTSALNVQCVLSDSTLIKDLTVGTSVKIIGEFKELETFEKCEIQIQQIEILGISDAKEYKIQPKRHSMDFLSENLEMRIRTNTFGSIFRIRSSASKYINQYFDSLDFIKIDTPILSANDCEGAGETFKIYNGDKYFGSFMNLTVSGQLEAEILALGLNRVYTFGPTFRAEKSSTTRHLSEFWMVEPELCFTNLTELLYISENLIKFVGNKILENNTEDLKFLKVDTEKLYQYFNNPFFILEYSDAIEILSKHGYDLKFGDDLNSEQEKFLTEHFKTAVFVINFPKEIKSFYMKENIDCKTVASFDLLFPGIGEIIGGSMREDNYEILKNKMENLSLLPELNWYLESRKFGSVPHGGFGLGFERLIMILTGQSNIKDTIPFPNFYKSKK